jgi:hypothetical protein
MKQFGKLPHRALRVYAKAFPRRGGGPTKKMADDGADDILRSIKDAQRDARMERAWKVAHEAMRRDGLSDTTIASGHLMAAMTLWQRELRKRGSEQAANRRDLLKQLFDGLFDDVGMHFIKASGPQ